MGGPKGQVAGKRTTRGPGGAEGSMRARYVARRSGWSGWLWVTGGATVVAGIVALIVHGARLPAGTQTFPETDHRHVAGNVQYDRTPPAGGAHWAVWQNCGIYDQPVPSPAAVHSLEHGAVWVTYQPALPASEVMALRGLVQSAYWGSQRYVLLSPYPGDPAPIVASAWGAQLRVHSPSDPRLPQFIRHFVGGGQGGESGAPCTNGTGVPLDA